MEDEVVFEKGEDQLGWNKMPMTPGERPTEGKRGNTGKDRREPATAGTKDSTKKGNG